MAERITGHTELIGLMAHPIRHSLSPAMHNEAFAKLGLDYAYLAFEVDKEQLKDAVQSIRALRMRGCNISMPNKTLVCEYLDKLSPAARLVGAVNTIVNDDGVLTGHITDGTGYMRSVKEAGVDIIGKKMTIAGVGGASRAICIQAALDGVQEISIYNIKDKFYESGQETVDKIMQNTNCKATLNDLADTAAFRKDIAESAILINATGLGMKPMEDRSIVTDETMLRPDLVVSDTVYNPIKTKLLSMAEACGCKTVSGLGMMLWQGAAAFTLWTGKEMPVEYVKEVVFDIQ